MTRSTYIQAVFSRLKRLTRREREAIRRELDGHMEDHFEALRELGYDEREAEERTIAAMGDPAEVGRALDRQYTGWGFVLLSRAAVLLTAVLCVQTLLGLGILGNFYDSVRARISPEAVGADRDFSPQAVTYPDLRIPVGNDVLRIYRVSVGTFGENIYAAEVAMVAYDRIPGGVVSERLTEAAEFADQWGCTLKSMSGRGQGSFGADYSTQYLSICEGDAYITLTYDRLGEHVAVEIPLPEGGAS